MLSQETKNRLSFWFSFALQNHLSVSIRPALMHEDIAEYAVSVSESTNKANITVILADEEDSDEANRIMTQHFEKRYRWIQEH